MFDALSHLSDYATFPARISQLHFGVIRIALLAQATHGDVVVERNQTLGGNILARSNEADIAAVSFGFGDHQHAIILTGSPRQRGNDLVIAGCDGLL